MMTEQLDNAASPTILTLPAPLCTVSSTSNSLPAMIVTNESTTPLAEPATNAQSSQLRTTRTIRSDKEVRGEGVVSVIDWNRFGGEMVLAKGALKGLTGGTSCYGWICSY